MTVKSKQIVITLLALVFLGSLILVQWREVARKYEEVGLVEPRIVIQASSQACVDCHIQQNRGIVEHWKGSEHALKGIGCYECHQAEKTDPDGFEHEGSFIATVVTPLDCSRCHQKEFDEFESSHHAKAGNILASLDNFLAETVEGSRETFDPHSPTPGMKVDMVNGMASAFTGCQQCHGSKVSLQSVDGEMINVDHLEPDEKGKPTNAALLAQIARKDNSQPVFHSGTWPNTGVGRLNLDGSLGSCSACHSRHDFSPRRARQPENCGKCHLGPDHPQKEIYEESKHGVAYRDLKDQLNLGGESWVLGKDYAAAPTCATCHMSANTKNEEKVTHDPGRRISWTNRPPVSLVMDTDAKHVIVRQTDPARRAELITDTAMQKRDRMKNVCSHCHTPNYVTAFYKQYDDFVILYNEKFAKPGKKIMAALLSNELITKTAFDDEIEWTWFYLWHHEGRRARHGASMMAPDYAHWHGMYEVAERFYMEMIPQARELAHGAEQLGQVQQAVAVNETIDAILARPEHRWISSGAEQETEAVRKGMEKRYGKSAVETEGEK